MKLYWFNSSYNPPCDKQVEAFYGFVKYPDNKFIEDYDLRQVGHYTFDEAIKECDTWYTFQLGDDYLSEYKEAERLLKDYLTGKLEIQLENRKLELKYPPKKSSVKRLDNELPEPKTDTQPRRDGLEQEVMKYADDGTYVFMKHYISVIKTYLNHIQRYDHETHQILYLFYARNETWVKIADTVCLSEQYCREKRKKAVKELSEWLFQRKTSVLHAFGG